MDFRNEEPVSHFRLSRFLYKRGLIGKFSSNRFLLACLLYHNLKSYNANQAATATKAAKKKTIGLISNKTSLHVQHTFFVHFFAVVLHDDNVNLPETS